jgi:hypothetical protein
MFNKISAALIVISAIATGISVEAKNQIGNGKCGKATVSFGQLTGRIQCNYKHDAKARNSQE